MPMTWPLKTGQVRGLMHEATALSELDLGGVFTEEISRPLKTNLCLNRVF